MPFGERQKVEKMNDGFAVEKLPKVCCCSIMTFYTHLLLDCIILLFF